MDERPIEPEEMARTLAEYREVTAALLRATPETDDWRILARRSTELEAEIRSWPHRHRDGLR